MNRSLKNFNLSLKKTRSAHNNNKPSAFLIKINLHYP